MTVKTRISATFSWELVDRSLLRDLLTLAYTRSGRKDDVEALADLEPGQLPRAAARALGERPNKRTRESVDLGRFLRDEWLPIAPPSSLESLAFVVGRDPLTSRRAQLRFLQGRNLTASFRAHLWSAFVSAHKERREVPVRPPVAETRAAESRITLAGAGKPSRYASPYPR